MTDSTVKDLYNRFKAMSPKERNEAIQATYTGVLADRYDKELTEETINLLKAITKSFDISIKYEELSRDDDSDVL